MDNPEGERTVGATERMKKVEAEPRKDGPPR